MPWGVYITRAEVWSMNEGKRITPEEWMAVVRCDHELHVVHDTGPYIAEWLPDNAEMLPNPSMPDGWYFQWDEGNIYAQRPSNAVILKLEGLAAKLGAVVQCEDGEVFHNSEPVRQ
jgi:hypothetical protein